MAGPDVPAGRVLRVLLLEDSENDAMLLLRELRRGGYEPVCERVYTPEGMRAALGAADARDEPFEVVISDYYMPRFQAPDALDLLRELGYDVPFIVVSGKIGEDAAVGIMKAGANDYLTKENMARLCPAIGRELEEAQGRREREKAEAALAQSEIRFRLLVEQAGDAIFVHDLEGRFVDVNRQACESLGYTREELLGMSVGEVEIEFDEGSLDRLWRQVFSGGPRTLEGTHRRKDGTTFPVEVRAGVFQSEARPLVLALVRDVTERREAEARYRTLVEQIPAVTYVQEPTGAKRTRYVSPQVETVLVYPADRELLDPDHWTKIMHPDDRERVLAEDERTDVTGEPFKVEYRQFAKDGRMVWIRDEAVLVRDDEGNPLYWQGVQLDITEQKRTEEELRRAEQRYKTFIAQSTEGIWRFELEEPIPTDLPAQEQIDRIYRDAYLAECNDAMAQMYGFEQAEQIVGARLEDLMPRSDPRNIEFLLEGLRGGYRMVDAETRDTASDGEPRVFLNNLAGIIEDGLLKRIWGIQRDVTEQKRAETKLQVSEARLRVAVEATRLGTWDFDPATQKVEWDDRTKSTFGLPPDAEVDYDTFLERVHPDDRERVRRLTERALDPAGSGEYETEYRTIGPEDGVERWAAARGRAFFEDGHAVRFVGTVLDITEHKRAEEELRRLASFPELNPNPIVETTVAGEPTYLNPAAWTRFPDLQTLGPRHPVLRDLDDIGREIQAAGRPYVRELEVAGRVYQQTFALTPEGGLWRVYATDVTERKLAEVALRESEERFRSLVQNASDIIVVMDEAGTIVYESPAVERVLGFKPEDRVGTNAFGLVHPDDRFRVSAMFAGRRDEPGPFPPVEYRVRDSEGAWRYLEAIGENLLRDPNIRGVVVNIRDVTERRRTEEALKQSEELLRTVVTNAPVVLFSLDSEGTYTLSTGRGLEALGLRPDELKGRSVFDVYADAPRVIEQVRRALAGEELVGFSEVGGVIFETWYEPLRGPDGETLGVIGVATDVTERTEAEEGLRRTLKELADLKFALDESAIVAITDQRGRITYVNEKFCEISGYSEAELLGQDHRLINSGHHPKAYIRGLWRTIAQGKVWRGELRNRAKDGSIYWVDTTIVPFLDERGKPYQYVAIRHDVTGRKEGEEALRAAEARYRTLVEQIPAVIYVDAAGGDMTTYISPQIEALTGYAAAEYLSTSGLWKSLIHPDDRERVVAGFERATASGEPFGMEYRFVARDGREVWVRDEAVLVRDEDGAPLFWQGVQLDVTAQRRAEEERRASEERFRATFDRAAVGMAQVATDGRLLRVNPKLCEILGYDEAELLGLTFLDITHPDDLEEDIGYLARLLAGEISTFSMQKRYLPKEGPPVWANLTVSLVREASGEPEYLIGVVEDITERRMAEEALRQSEERFRATFEQAAVGVALVGARGKLLRVNGKLCEYLGYTQDELLEMSVQDITHPEDAEKDIGMARRVLGGETGTYTLEKRYLRKGGSVVWANVSASLVRDASGEPDYFIGVVEDISQRKGAEERTQFLANLTQALQAADGPEEVKAAASRLLGGYLGADLCAYAEVEADEDHFDVVGAYSSASGPPGMGGRSSISRLGAEALRLARANRPYVVFDSEADERGAAYPAAYRQARIRALMLVPLRKTGRLVAGMVVHQTAPRRWSHEEVELAATVVDRCWESVERTRAVRNLRQSEELYRSVIEQAEESIYLVDLDTRRVLEANAALARTLGYTEAELENMTLYDIVAHDRESIDENTKLIVQERRRSLGERRYRRRDGTFADVEVNVSAIRYRGREVLCIVAHDLTERKRAEEALREIREAERNRIARELHDSILQDIVYGLQEIQVMQLTAPYGEDPALEGAADALRRSVEGLRGAIFELRLNETLSQSFLSSLRGLVALNRRMSRGRYEVDLDLGEGFPTEISERAGRELVRVVQEALTNVRRHAVARRVRVELGADGDRAYVEVADDGRGFDTGEPRTGVGQHSMRQRARELGGELEVESEPGRGTRVRLTAPTLRLKGT